MVFRVCPTEEPLQMVPPPSPPPVYTAPYLSQSDRARLTALRRNQEEDLKVIYETLLLVQTALLLFVSFTLIGVAAIDIEGELNEWLLVISGILDVIIFIGWLLASKRMLSIVYMLLSLLLVVAVCSIVGGILFSIFLLFIADDEFFFDNCGEVHSSMSQWIGLCIFSIGVALQRLIVKQLMRVMFDVKCAFHTA